MKSAFFVLALSIFSFNAHARDSTWFLCDNSKLALNVLEHRGENSTGAVEFALMFGARIMQGTLKGQDRDLIQSGPVTLTGQDASFTGTATIDLQKKTARVTGGMILDGGSPEKIDATFKCKEMDNNWL